MSPSRFLSGSLLLLCGLSTSLTGLFSEEASVEGKAVREVRFVGIEDYQKDQVLTRIQTRPGRRFAREVADEDIKRLIAAGYFCKEYRVELAGDQVDAVFVISPSPLIDSIEFTGTLKKRMTKRLKDLIQARKGDLLRPHQINADKQAILLELKSKGHHFAKVDHEILPGPAGGATVRFNVNPEKKVRVKDVVFKGATAFSKRKLLKIMKTKVDHWYNSAKYIQDNFEEDIKRIREFYRLKGWLDAETSVASVDFMPNKKKVVLTMTIVEGDKYSVDTVSFKGNDLFTTEQLESITELRAGQPFSPEALEKDMKKLRDKYGEKGYVRNEIKIDQVVSKEGKKVKLGYDIVEGQKCYVETINVAGNTRTKDVVVRREIDLVPGEEFNTVKLEGSLRRVRNLGFFESVDSDYTPGSDPSLSTVNIKVKEGKTGLFRVGAGFSSNNNLIGSIGVTQRNFDYKDVPKSWHDFLVGNAFVGDGQTLSLEANPGTVLNRYRISFTEPYLFDRPIVFGLGAFHFDRDRDVYSETRTGATARLGKRLIPDLRVEGIYRFEVVRLRDVDADEAPLAVIDAQGTTNISSVTLEVSYDKRDDYFFPTKGYRSEADYELEGTIFGGDLDIHKVTLGHSQYFTVYRTKDENAHVLSFQGRTGWEDDLLNTDGIPIFERFFLGGSNSIRGFEFRTVGPQQLDEPIGGEFFYQLNAEYRFPLYGKIFQGVLFNDIGNVTPHLGSGEEFSTWRAAAGFGIRIRVPQLGPIPITFDFGFPWRKEDGDDTELLSFQFGTVF
jgi:outer membrane protein insertion porin family